MQNHLKIRFLQRGFTYQTNIMDSNGENKDRNDRMEMEPTCDIDSVPKDSGWAWMCCFGTYDDL